MTLGAGAGVVREMNFKGLVKMVYGVDPDPRVVNNSNLDQGIIGNGDSMLFFKNNMFDAVIANNVLEHIQKPISFFSEIQRVLKPGGVFLTKTPNRFHYVPIIARLTPSLFHKWINRVRGRREEDTFPTLYRANTKKQQIRVASNTGLEPVFFKFVEGRPEYLRMNSILYFLGMLYEKTINTFNFEALKVIIISCFRKSR